jgi:hypothetical protein
MLSLKEETVGCPECGAPAVDGRGPHAGGAERLPSLYEGAQVV